VDGNWPGAKTILEMTRQADTELSRVKVAGVEVESKYDGCLWEFISIPEASDDAMLQFSEKWDLADDTRAFDVLWGLVSNVLLNFAGSGFTEKILCEADFPRDSDLPADDDARWKRIMSEADDSRRKDWLVTESRIAAYKISSAFMFHIFQGRGKLKEYTAIAWIFWYYLRTILLLAAKIREGVFDDEASEMGFALYLFEEVRLADHEKRLMARETHGFVRLPKSRGDIPKDEIEIGSKYWLASSLSNLLAQAVPPRFRFQDNNIGGIVLTSSDNVVSAMIIQLIGAVSSQFGLYRCSVCGKLFQSIDRVLRSDRKRFCGDACRDQSQREAVRASNRKRRREMQELRGNTPRRSRSKQEEPGA
jgi:hypothetical protein